ncbi:hypothetical protein JOQ06_008937 [Pogonophryne albipinna]|uniref:Uncharacterized protein n=1 Tax=Pogonophryne albipinna TaxID=1090488 RepID=A0AAD6BM31_9TELE|nr:hypothetical protein JOQ06_008937 [Pogonophryne albipinna]
MSKWATAPPPVSQEETGAAQVRASQDWLCLGHYLEGQPLRGLDTVQRSRVLDIRVGNSTAWSLLIRLSIKRDGIQRSSQSLTSPRFNKHGSKRPEHLLQEEQREMIRGGEMGQQMG